MKRLPLFQHWLPLAFVITCLCGLVYLSAQQSLRQGANDPQIQLSEDAASNLSTGLSPETLLPETGVKIDLSKSLSPFMIVYSEDGKVLSSSGNLNGQTPTLPNGIFDAARNTQDRFTWQPTTGVRVAAVITHYKGINSGFVLAGRSLKEVEKRERNLSMEVGAAWIVTMLGSLILVIFY